MLEQAVEAVIKLRIPLIPVVAAAHNVKFVGKMAFFQQVSEATVGGQQPFRVAAG